MLRFNIRNLLHKPQGSRETVRVDESVQLPEPGDPKLTQNLTMQVTFLKLPHEIHVQLKDVSTVVTATCSRCLKSFSYAIKIPHTEREFIIDLPDELLASDEEVSYVNKEKNEIELGDTVREEIILHFSAIPLCSKSCKGLCYQCGTNLNLSQCSCQQAAHSTNPFKILQT